MESAFERPVEDQDRALVIVIGPSGPDGEAVRDLMALWARAELIRPCYWLTPQDHGVGVVDAHRLDTSGAVPVRLPDDLGRVAWMTCRVILLQLVAPEISPDLSVAPFAEQYAQFLARTVLTGNTALLRVNLLVPASNAGEVDPGVLVTGWEQTVVVSPEQRASPDHPNVLVLHDSNLHGHAAVSAASAAGLWFGMDGTPLTELVPESASGEASPRMMRSFVRAVRGGEVTRDLAEVALTPQNGRWRVPTSDGRPLVPASDPAHLVEDTISQITDIDHGALAYADPPSRLAAQKRSAGWKAIWETFKEYFALFTQRIKDIPGRLVTRAENKISTQFFGPDGAHEFGFGVEDIDARAASVVELRKEIAGQTDDSVRGQARVAQRALSVLGREHRPEAARVQAWVELRQMCLGMVDGGALPAGIDPPMLGAAREIITDPAHLVPNSELPRWMMPDEACGADAALIQYRGITLPQCDPLLTLRLDRDLAAAMERRAQQVEMETQLVHIKEAEADSLQKQASAAEKAEEDGSEFGEQAKRATAEAEEAGERAEEHQVWVDRLSDVIEDLEEWAEPRLGTLMWRVGESVGGALESATLDQRGALAGSSDMPQFDVEAVDAARKRVSKMLVVWLAAAVAISVVGITGLDFTYAPLVGVLVLIGGVIASFSRYTRVKSEAEWRYASARAEQINNLNRLVHAAREVSRLSGIYTLYIEWAEILGYEAHRPWIADDDVEGQTPVVDLDPTRQPPALVVGSSEVDSETMGALGSLAAQDLQNEGWLLERYQEARGFAMARKANQEGRPVDDLDPDSDSLMAPTGAREFLLEDLRSHRPQQAAYRTALDDIAQFCASLEPNRLFKAVSVAAGPSEDVTAFLSALVPDPHRPASHFLVDLLTPAGALKRAAEDVTSYVWVPTGVGGTDVRTVPVPTTGSGQYLLTAVRIDLSRELGAGDLRLLEHRAERVAAPVTAGEDTGEW